MAHRRRLIWAALDRTYEYTELNELAYRAAASEDLVAGAVTREGNAAERRGLRSADRPIGADRDAEGP